MGLMLFKQFSKYFSIGILNTLVHWGVFSLCYFIFELNQSTSNVLGFITAVIFSFYMNAKFTFKQSASFARFISYTSFMGILSYLVGYLADTISMPALLTLLIFSAISLVCGFLYSKLIVFKEK